MPYRLLLKETHYVACCRILQGLPYFRDHRSLQLLFGVAELAPYQHHLPEAGDATERVERCVHFLMGYPVAINDDPPLITLLRIVRDRPLSQGLDFAEFDRVNAIVCEELRQQLQDKCNDQERERVSREYGVVAGTVADSATADAYAWLDLDNLNIAEIALKVALAVFDGAQFGVFKAAASDLTQRLRQLVEPEIPHSDTEHPTLSPVIHKPNLRQQLTNAGATITEIKRPLSDGEAIGDKVIKLGNSTLNAGVLHALWTECIEWHEALVDWLSSYIQKKPADVRVRVAIAAGIIALVDFSYARQVIFLRWARNGDAESRAAVGQALSVVCQNLAQRADVFVMLRQWSKSDDPNLRWTTARCLRFVGAYEPTTAILLWRQIAASEPEAVETVAIQSTDNLVHVLVQRHNNPLHTSLYDAIMTFFMTVMTERELVRPVYEQSIIALQPWIEGELKQRPEPGFGTLVFLSLCGLLWQPSDSEDPLRWPPVLMVLVKEQSSYLQSLARIMWLAWRATHQHMRRVMPDWLARIELNPQYRQLLLHLFQAVIVHDRDQRKDHERRGMIEERLLRFLRDYATDPGQSAPNTIWIYNKLLETMG